MTLKCHFYSWFVLIGIQIMTVLWFGWEGSYFLIFPVSFSFIILIYWRNQVIYVVQFPKYGVPGCVLVVSSNFFSTPLYVLQTDNYIFRGMFDLRKSLWQEYVRNNSASFLLYHIRRPISPTPCQVVPLIVILRLIFRFTCYHICEHRKFSKVWI